MLPTYSLVFLPASISSSNGESDLEIISEELIKLSEKLILTTDRLNSSIQDMGDRLEKRFDDTDKKLDDMKNSVSTKLDERADRFEALLQSRNKV